MIIREVLDKINTNPKEAVALKGNTYLRNLLEAACLPEKRFVLPEGAPPYKEQPIPDGILGGIFWQVARKIPVFQIRHDKPMSKLRQETAFIQALETISKTDAKILLAVKDQTLHELYPNITLENLRKVGYFPPEKTK